METPTHDIGHLLRQLGYSGEPADVETFIAEHRLKSGEPLAQAGFWNPAQASFLAQAIAEDADWSRAVDELAVRLSATAA